MLTFYQALWILMIYAFLGWCAEVVFAASNCGKFVNRGFLNGPVCPIYGFGMLLVIICLMPLKENLAILFIGSILLTSFLEFITGFALEKLFEDKWWDYSDEPFNIKGYVCLKFSLLWGLACVFIVDIVHPLIIRLINWLPDLLGLILISIFSAIMVADVVITVAATINMKKRLRMMTELGEKFKELSNRIGESLSDGTIEVKEKLEFDRQEFEEIKAKYRKMAENNPIIQKRLLKSFPSLHRGKHKDSIKRIIQYWNEKHNT